MSRKNRLLKRLKGFQKAPRDRFNLLMNHHLTVEQFSLYELMLAVTDWDSRHENYSTFTATNVELAEVLGWKSGSTVSRHRAVLLKKGFIVNLEDGRTFLPRFGEWELRQRLDADMKAAIANLDVSLAETHSTFADNHEDQTQNAVYSLVSSKGGIGLLEKTDSDEGLVDEAIRFFTTPIVREG